MSKKVHLVDTEQAILQAAATIFANNYDLESMSGTDIVRARRASVKVAIELATEIDRKVDANRPK